MTAGELTRHINADYGTNPDLYLLVNGTPLEDSDKVSSDYRQQILLKIRLRGDMRRSSRSPARLDVTKELCIIRRGEPLDHMGQQEEDRQTRIKAELRKLRKRMWSQYHPLLPEMDRLLSATEGPISEDDLKNLHHLSTDCSTRPLSQRGLFCQGGCSYTGMGDPCPNQVPEWMRTGVNDPTEVGRGLVHDPADTYLKTKQGVPKYTFLAAFGEASIIRASEQEGVQLGILYDQIQKSESLDKCQYTVKTPMGTPTNHFWIIPQPDKAVLLTRDPPAELIQALSNPSTLQGHGHMAQHSCCKRADCQTSINTGLSLIFQASGNDEEDQCMGVDIVATRPINQGEQIFISYSGDEKIKDTWGEIFRCYYCQCQKSCVARIGRTFGGKRTEPVDHQGIRTSKSGLPPKKARNELHRPCKRKRNDQGTPDLEPSYKKRSPPVSRDIPGELGVVDRPEKHVDNGTEEDRDASAKGHHQEISVKDKGGEQNPNIKTKGLDTTDLVRSVSTDETDKVHRESIGGSETVFDPYQGLETT
jgi:hypothetical protein